MSEFGEGRAICDPLEFIMQTGEVDSCNYHLQIDGGVISKQYEDI